MLSNPVISSFEHALLNSIDNGSFIKLSLGNFKGDIADLKQIFVRKVFIKRLPSLAFTYRYKTRDIVKNYDIETGINKVVNYLQSGFNIATLFSNEGDVIFERFSSGKEKIRTLNVSIKKAISDQHDHQKNRIIKPNNGYLNALRITDNLGVVYKNAQDKYKQINHYVTILSSLINELPENSIKNVVDMGSGKGYLTFGLYDYLINNLNIPAQVIGVEYRQDMIDLCNDIAHQSDFKNLKFVQGTIENYECSNIDLLIALHACDTATDDAIFKGISGNSKLIVVAPCCHKQIRKEMEANKVENDLNFLTKYGIFLERQAEMVTDGLRALILEYFGYKTKVFQFVSDVHTPKNVLVVGIKGSELSTEKKQEILNKINHTKSYFGIGNHHLENLLKF